MKRVCVIIGILCASISLSAQNNTTSQTRTQSEQSTQNVQATTSNGENAKKNQNQVRNNWFITASGNAQFYFGDHNSQATFGQLIAPGATLEGGKWFNNIVGFKAGVHYGLSRGATQNGAHSTGAELPGKGGPGYWLKTQRFPYINAQADVVLDIINIFANDPYRTVKLLGYIGPGVAHTWDNPKATSFSGNAGLTCAIALTRNLDFNVGVDGTIVGDGFDGEPGGRPLEGTIALNLGLTWNFLK
ncbi:MAG: hypothetical protein HUJ92_00790 [Bacteroidales bacterium]|nr:hypothetical protein [Bacteroidales bacterium]